MIVSLSELRGLLVDQRLKIGIVGLVQQHVKEIILVRILVFPVLGSVQVSSSYYGIPVRMEAHGVFVGPKEGMELNDFNHVDRLIRVGLTSYWGEILLVRVVLLGF